MQSRSAAPALQVAATGVPSLQGGAQVDAYNPRPLVRLHTLPTHKGVEKFPYGEFSNGENSARVIFRTYPKKSRGKFRTS